MGLKGWRRFQASTSPSCIDWCFKKVPLHSYIEFRCLQDLRAKGDYSKYDLVKIKWGTEKKICKRGSPIFH